MIDATPRDASDSKRSHRSHVRITGKKPQSVPENNTMPRPSHPHLPRCIFGATNHTLKCTFMAQFAISNVVKRAISKM